MLGRACKGRACKGRACRGRAGRGRAGRGRACKGMAVHERHLIKQAILHGPLVRSETGVCRRQLLFQARRQFIQASGKSRHAVPVHVWRKVSMRAQGCHTKHLIHNHLISGLHRYCVGCSWYERCVCQMLLGLHA